MNVGYIDLPPKWNEGTFDLNINHCSECFRHYNYSRHSEDLFVQSFNDLGDSITALFPNVNIIGNYERPHLLDEFEVYLRGLGF